MSRTKLYLVGALTLIFFANFLSYCDRTIVSALETELKASFNLSTPEFGGLWTAFTLGYMLFAPIVGYLADRITRTRLLGVCILLWSWATIASGLATTAEILFAARFFIGIGEAGCLVIGPALISDLFSKAHRGAALSAFYLGCTPGRGRRLRGRGADRGAGSRSSAKG